METINEIPANGSLLEESTKNEKGQRGTSNECAVIFELDSEDEKQDEYMNAVRPSKSLTVLSTDV